MEETCASSMQPTENAERHSSAPRFRQKRRSLGPLRLPPRLHYPQLCRVLEAVHDQVERKISTETQSRFFSAVEEQRLDKIKYLVAQGVDVDCPLCARDETPLMHVIKLARVEVAKLLVTSGASVNKQGQSGCKERPLHLALDTQIYNHELVEFLLEHGAEVDGQDVHGTTPLHKACFLGDADAVKILLSAGASVTAADFTGKTALHLAVEKTHYELASYLLVQGADINASDRFGWTPLNQAIIFCDMHAFFFLLSHAADVNHVDNKSVSPVLIACDRLSRGNIHDILVSASFFNRRLKKERFPDPALRNLINGHPDCSQCQFRIVWELINAGADVRQIQVKQLVASQYNLQRFLPILRFLVLCGVKVEPGDEDLVPLSSQQFAVFRLWLRDQVTQQMSLPRICRDSVRRHLGTHSRDFEKSVEFLPLPHTVKQFLSIAQASEAECDEQPCSMSMYH
ncbi:hypothetical protein BaRGS_00014082 [Batillaria attramentaria]|uniref:SOCS box domain-containing protein n=1 Tax=Batillaria attramentaria TaxID=370345 RepID=A0ABD0L531_9CAEN